VSIYRPRQSSVKIYLVYIVTVKLTDKSVKNI
jgi:hypothetical protein